MKSRNISVIACFFALSLFSSLSFADSAYMIGQIQIDDHDAYFNKYGQAALRSFEGTDVKILVSTPTVTQLEGSWKGNWTVVLEFPSEAAALKWYQSENYQKNARPLRLQTSSFSNLVFAKKFAGLPK